MKSDIRDIHSRANWQAERLDSAIEILVIERVLIVPDASRRVSHFVTHEPDTIVARIGLDRVAHRRIGPSFNSRFLSHCGADGAKIEIRRATAHALLLIGDVVIHVALGRMTLAPSVFVRHHVLGFRKIGGTQILCWDKITRLHQNSVRRHVMSVAAVIVRS